MSAEPVAKHPRDMTPQERAAGLRGIQAERSSRLRAIDEAKILERLRIQKEAKQ